MTNANTHIPLEGSVVGQVITSALMTSLIVLTGILALVPYAIS